jgi:DNA invertase Pin-like site-specific DNA recombinase
MSKALNVLWEKAGAIFPIAKTNKKGRPRKSLPKEKLMLADDIGIAEACRRMGVARSTFYRHKQWMSDKS